MSLNTIHKKRRAITALICSGLVALTVLANPNNYQNKMQPESVSAGASESANEVKNSDTAENTPLASEVLAKLEVKGRAPKTGYKRTEFYNGWPDIDGCNLRQRILKRDFGETAVTDEKCNVVAGKFYEPYTGEVMEFHTRKEISKAYKLTT